MKNLSRASILTLILWFAFGPLALFAQADKVTLNLTPKPNQTSHLRLTQEMDFDVSFEGNVPSELAAMGPMKIVGKFITAFSRKAGQPDAMAREDCRKRLRVAALDARDEFFVGGFGLRRGRHAIGSWTK